MPTNRELKAEIDELSELLGESVDTGRMNNADLTALAQELRARAGAGDGPDLELEPPADDPPDPGPRADETPPAPSVPVVDLDARYIVAANRSVTSQRGTRRAGEEVTARDFIAGEETLARLLGLGTIERV